MSMPASRIAWPIGAIRRRIASRLMTVPPATPPPRITTGGRIATRVVPFHHRVPAKRLGPHRSVAAASAPAAIRPAAKHADAVCNRHARCGRRRRPRRVVSRFGGTRRLDRLCAAARASRCRQLLAQRVCGCRRRSACAHRGAQCRQAVRLGAAGFVREAKWPAPRRGAEGDGALGVPPSRLCTQADGAD